PLRRLLRRATGLETRSKRPFTAPIDRWMRGPLREVAHESLSRLAGLETLEVDRRAVRRLFQDHLSGRKNAGLALWRLVLMDLWITHRSKRPPGERGNMNV